LVLNERIRAIQRVGRSVATTSQRERSGKSEGLNVPKAGPRRPLQAVPRFALTREEAAASLGMSVSHFERNVQPTMGVVRSGQLVLVPVAELERWLQRNAHLVVDSAPGPQLVRDSRR
jgi:AraC-like DNA-binding protein